MTVRVIEGDCRKVLAALPAASVNCIVTSPPYYGLRDYGVDGQIGLEQTPDAYVAEMVAVFREARRVLKDDGTLWLNLGDSYAMSTKGAGGRGKQQSNVGSVHADRSWRIPPRAKPKDLLMIPARVALALQADGWFLRSEIIWSKPNPMPESVKDRPTSAHEKVYLFAKSARYHYDADAVKEAAVQGERFHGAYDKRPGPRRERNGRHDAENVTALRNLRNVWTITPKPFKGAHFAVFPPALVEPCIKAGCPIGGTVLDPFGGSGTTGLVAESLGRNALLIELNPSYAAMAEKRLAA